MTPNVLQVVTSAERRGAETFAVDLAVGLERRGCAIRTVALSTGDRPELAVPALGSRALAPTTLQRLRAEALRASVVVAHGSTTLPACATALLGSGVPFVYRNIGDPTYWGNTTLRRLRVGTAIRRAAAVAALTDGARDALHQLYRIPLDRLVVIPSGVSSTLHRPADAAERAAARARLGLPASVRVATAVAALSPEKGLDVAIDAVSDVDDLHLVIAGDGRDRADLEARAERRAPGRVHFLGNLPDPADAYAAADVFVLPSRTEGLPAALIEAGLRGLPAVATDVGYVRDVVVDGVTGVVVAPGDEPRTARGTRAGAGDGRAGRRGGAGALRGAVRPRARRGPVASAVGTDRLSAMSDEACGDGRDTVLFVSALSFLGGAQVSLASVVDSLDPTLRVVLAAPSEGVLVDRVRAQGSVDEFVPIPSRRNQGVLRSRIVVVLVLGRWLLRNRRALVAVHANGDAEMKLLLPVIALIRVPIVVWFHRAELSATTTRLAFVWRVLARRIVWASVSEVRRDELAAAGIGTARTRVVVPNPIDPAAVVPDSPHTPSRTLVVGYLGCEYAAKGFLLLPEIAELLRDVPVRLLCVMKGLSPDRVGPEITAATERLAAMPDTVEFRDRTFDVREIYADVDVILVPSRSESFCRVAAEAMLNGLPVVGSDLPAIRELVDDGAGLLFPTDDARAAAARITELVADPDLRTRLGTEGRRRASRFAPRAVAARLEALYRLRVPVDASGQA